MRQLPRNTHHCKQVREEAVHTEKMSVGRPKMYYVELITHAMKKKISPSRKIRLTMREDSRPRRPNGNARPQPVSRSTVRSKHME